MKQLFMSLFLLNRIKQKHKLKNIVITKKNFNTLMKMIPEQTHTNFKLKEIVIKI